MAKSSWLRNNLSKMMMSMKAVITPCSSYVIGGGTRGALGASAPAKFIIAHRNLVFHNRNMSC